MRLPTKLWLEDSDKVCCGSRQILGMPFSHCPLVCHLRPMVCHAYQIELGKQPVSDSDPNGDELVRRKAGR